MPKPLSPHQWSEIQQSLQLKPSSLPWTKLKQAWLLDSPFADSTHYIVKLDSDSGCFYLKWLRSPIAQQPYWQYLKAWMGYDLAEGYAFQADWAKLLQQHTPFKLVQIKQAKSPSPTQSQGYVLSAEMAGTQPSSKDLDSAALALFAQHFSQLHGLQSAQWGHPFLSAHSAQTWSLHTFAFLQQLGLPKDLVSGAIEQAAAYQIDEFVPVMLDFRWDQIQWQDNQPIGIVDMDAWLMAPVSLNLVMLEYLFTPEQAQQWRCDYHQTTAQQGIDSQKAFKQLSAWRAVFRLILFKLNWLGAEDLQAWLSAPTHFEATTF